MLVSVKVSTEAKKDEIVRIGEDRFEVKTKAKAKNNKANLAVIRILAKYFVIDISSIKIVKGFKQKSKVFKIS